MNGEAIDKEGFHRLVTHYADLLKRSGAQPGDRILITINISTKFYAMAVATLAIGKIIDSIPYGSVGYNRQLGPTIEIYNVVIDAHK